MKVKIRPVILTIAGGLTAALILSILRNMGDGVINPLIVGLTATATKMIESEEAGEKDVETKTTTFVCPYVPKEDSSA